MYTAKSIRTLAPAALALLLFLGAPRLARGSFYVWPLILYEQLHEGGPGGRLPVSPGILRTGLFIRPLTFYSQYLTSGYTNRGGYGMAAGFVAAQNHEFSVEWDNSSWTSTNVYAPSPGPGTFNVAGSGHITPYYLNYRYYFGSKGSPTRFYIGPSGGAAEVKGHYSLPLSGLAYSGDFSHWSFAYAASAGVSLTLFKSILVELGYRYQNITSYDAPLYLFGNPSGALRTYNPGSIRSNILYTAMTIAF